MIYRVVLPADRKACEGILTFLLQGSRKAYLQERIEPREDQPREVSRRCSDQYSVGPEVRYAISWVSDTSMLSWIAHSHCKDHHGRTQAMQMHSAATNYVARICGTINEM